WRVVTRSPGGVSTLPMPPGARSAAAASAAPSSSPGMNRRVARRKAARLDSCRASQVLRDARSSRRRASDIGGEETVERMIAGIMRRYTADEARVERGAAVLDE